MRGGKRTIKRYNNHQVKGGRLCYALPCSYERLKTTFPGGIAALPIAKGLRAEENMESVAPEPVIEEIDGS